MLNEEDEVSQQERVDKWGIMVNEETSQAYWIFIPKKESILYKNRRGCRQCTFNWRSITTSRYSTRE